MIVISANHFDIAQLDLTVGLFWEMTYYTFDYKEQFLDSLGQK